VQSGTFFGRAVLEKASEQQYRRPRKSRPFVSNGHITSLNNLENILTVYSLPNRE